MKRRAGVILGVYLAVVGLLLLWALWLLATDDPDGGRHPAGGVLLVAALLLGVAGLVSWHRSQRGP